MGSSSLRGSSLQTQFLSSPAEVATSVPQRTKQLRYNIESFSIKTAVIEPIESTPEIEDNGHVVAINSLNSERLELIRPVSVFVKKSEQDYIAKIFDFEVSGYGETEAEAIEDLKIDIEETYFDFTDNADRLGPIPKRALLAFKEFIKEK